VIPNDPTTWTISVLARALRKKELSPVEVTRTFLERIETHDPKINAFITILPRQALKAARQAEKEILQGRYLGAWHGIPFAAKDLFFTKGIRTTCGSKILTDFIPRYSASVIERLLAAGAILLGKLNMHEFAFGATSINPHFGPVRNPWDFGRISGGSSGGSAAALACSFAPLTLGTDSGGSIRIPAALCGIAGLKPTYGRISRFGVYPLSWSLDHPGPMAKNVADLAQAMNILAGFDPRDPTTAKVPVPDYTQALTQDLSGLRLGIPDNFFFERIDEEIHSAVEKAIRDLKSLGAKVRPISVPNLPEATAAAFLILYAEGAASLDKWYRIRPQDMGDDIRNRLSLGSAIKATHYLKAQRIRRKMQEYFLNIFKAADALVTPQVPITAPKLDEKKVILGKRPEEVPSALTRFTRIFNLNGFPCLSLPCGFSSSGMPIGLQVVGRPFDEETVLKVGHAYESQAPWKTQHPKIS